ncbi:hypothetical protein ABHF33_02010 [Chitinibacter sp. FCG-7]|uniref:Uncharacterized protein n=1 Tax=Chitinibacter mangrovi TaxID=3153927 RepID=A0AAU7FC15_9NEIS
MAKYQFFQLSKDGKKLVRYLCTDREDFLPAKELLLGQGFEVIGDMIYASNDQEAIDHFNSGMIYPLAEYNKAEGVGGLFYFVKGIYEEARDFYRRRANSSHQNKPNL